MALAIASCRPADAGLRVGDLTVRGLRATAAPDSDGGTVYFAVHNGGSRPDTLLETRVDSNLADLHTVERMGGMMHMAPAGPAAIAPGATLVLHPGGMHLMFSEPRRRIGLGDTLHVSVRFAVAGRVTTIVVVGPYTSQ